MKRILLALFLAASVVAIAQEPKPTAPKTAAEKKAEKKAKKAEALAAKAAPAAPAAPAKPTSAAAKPTPASAAVPAPASAKPAPAATKAVPAKAVAASTAIIANKDSKTYHRADCKVGAKMKDANRTSFASAAEADKAGYKACKVCKP